MTADQALVLPVLIPLGAAFLTPIAARISPVFGRIFASAGALAGLIAALFLARLVLEAGPQVTAIGGFQAPFGIVFTADLLSILFLAILYLSLLIFWPKANHGGVKADGLMLLLAAGGSGLLLSGDLFNLFVFYEIVAIASYGLAASNDTAGSVAASLRYLLLSALGSAFALLAIALIYAMAGTLNLADLAVRAPESLNNGVGIAAFLLLVLGFGVKAEIFPVNTWVPEVYAQAPARVSAVLAGIISKLALLVILRVMVLVYAEIEVGSLLLLLGLAAVIIGELAALRALDLSRMLAWSSIAQLGLVAIAFSISGTAGLTAGIALALHHAIVKPVLFVLAETWSGRISDLAGAAKSCPLAAGLFVLLALSMAGIPPLPGFWAKYLLLDALFGAGGQAQVIAAFIILAAVVIEGAYLFAVVRALYDGAEKQPIPRPPLPDIAKLAGVGVLLLAAVIYIVPVGTALHQTAVQTLDRDGYIARILPASEDRP
jgi:formate hydrogenlyase subunit 3/multisubunit Na+/H+ antiporter MnhD subunit